MTRTIIAFILLFVALVVAQVVIFNRIWLFNVAIPLVFIYFIVELPEETNVKLVLTFSFLLGFVVDIFSNTMGLNTLCCTLLGALRLPVFRLYVPRDEESGNAVPAMATMGRAAYMKYLITMTTLYCIFFFSLLSMDFFNFARMMVRIFSSSLLTFVLLLALSNFLTPSASKK